MRRGWLLALIALGTAGGCGRATQADGPGSGDGARPAADSPADGRIVLADGFESGSLADFWLPANYGTGLYAPGAIVVSTDYARGGTRSAKITVHEGDIEQRGDDGRA